MATNAGEQEAEAARETAILREFLAVRDAPCPGCGYNLRGLTGSSCPECGVPIELDLRRDEAGLWWRRWAAPALAWPALIAVIYGLNYVAGLLGWSGSGPGQWYWFAQNALAVWVAAAGVVACVTLAIVSLRRRSRASPRTRRRWLALVWVLFSGFACFEINMLLSFWW